MCPLGALADERASPGMTPESRRDRPTSRWLLLQLLLAPLPARSKSTLAPRLMDSVMSEARRLRLIQLKGPPLLPPSRPPSFRSRALLGVSESAQWGVFRSCTDSALEAVRVTVFRLLAAACRPPATPLKPLVTPRVNLLVAMRAASAASLRAEGSLSTAGSAAEVGSRLEGEESLARWGGSGRDALPARWPWSWGERGRGGCSGDPRGDRSEE
mmetsp:Transcript_4067/g.11791  ORF Transcript_4067/g.11791 Transcript_4067/m.11791 type:complete len:214 (-) Transcript_4067:4277-4918(-)